MAVGFALAYYLIGAVLIDTKAQELHDALGSKTPTSVKSAKDIRIAQKKEVELRRKVYWRVLLRFLLWHIWSLALATALIWTFQSSLRGYGHLLLLRSGLHWFDLVPIHQDLHWSSCAQASHHWYLRRIADRYRSQGLRASFASCTLRSSVLELPPGLSPSCLSGMPRWVCPTKLTLQSSSAETFHAFTTPWSDPEWSQQELQTFFETYSLLPSDSRFKLNPAVHPGIEIKSAMTSRREELRIEEAFPGSKEIVNTAISSWEKGDTVIELVPIGSLGPGIRALSCSTGNQLKLAISVGGLLDERLDISANCQVIAETLLHAVTELMMGVPHEYASLAGSIVSGGVTHTMARQLREEANTSTVVRWAKKELLRQLCLGFEADIHWDKLPTEVRDVLLKRCLGQQCSLSNSQRQWLQESLCTFDTKDLDIHVARCNLGAATAISVLDYAHWGTGEAALPKESETSEYISYVPRKLPLVLSLFRSPVSYIYHKLGTMVKFFVVALVADPEFQREFNHVTQSLPTVVRVPTVFLFNMLWVYSKVVQDLGLSFFLFHGRQNVKRLWEETKGMTIHIKKSRVIVQSLDGTFTAFRHHETDGGFKIYHYAGDHKTEPKEVKALKYVSTYSSEMLLLVKQEFKDGKVTNEYHYDYQSPTKKGFKLGKSSARIPLGRRCVSGANHLQSVQYNRKGLIESGSYMKDGNLIRFKYHYRKNPRFGDELLRAEFVLSHISCTVSWCAPPRRHPEKVERWIPHSKVTEASFVQGADVYESRWLYDHKFHPTIFTTINGQKVQTPPMIEHDYLGVLAKPKYTSFVHDNPFFYCRQPPVKPVHPHTWIDQEALRGLNFSCSLSYVEGLEGPC